jgi:hypothetical protein
MIVWTTARCRPHNGTCTKTTQLHLWQSTYLVVVVLWYLYIEMKYTAFPVAFLCKESIVQQPYLVCVYTSTTSVYLHTWYYGYDESPEIVVIGEVNCTGFCGSREE